MRPKLGDEMNHCIHGTELDGYCPGCELEMQTFDEWVFGAGTAGKVYGVEKFSVLLDACVN